MAHLNKKGPEEKGSAAGRNLGLCNENADNSKLGKGLGLRRKAQDTKVGRGFGKRLRSGLK